MSKAESLAMLTTHGVNPLNVPGGHSDFSPLDIAAAMSRLDDREYSLLAAKYMLDKTAKHKSWAYWFAAIMDQKEFMLWNLEQSKTEKLATATLDEFLGGLNCKTCKGVGSISSDQKMIVCGSCNGIGRRHLSNREMARRLELPNDRRLEREGYVEIIEWCREILRIWEANALAKMRD